MVCETLKPNWSLGKRFIKRLISVPFPTPEGPQKTTGRRVPADMIVVLLRIVSRTKRLVCVWWFSCWLYDDDDNDERDRADRHGPGHSPKRDSVSETNHVYDATGFSNGSLNTTTTTRRGDHEILSQTVIHNYLRSTINDCRPEAPAF